MTAERKALPVATQIAIVAATNAALRALGRAPMHLSSDDRLLWEPAVGAKVRVRQLHRWPGLPDVTFAIMELVGKYENAMAKLQSPSGEVYKWLRATELLPASQTEGKEDQMSNPEERILMRATAIAAERQIHLSAAVKLASAEDAAASRAYLQHPEPTAKPSQVISLRRDDGETLPTLVARVARERCNGDQVQALRLVADAHPDLVRNYSDGTTL